jgi:hypothetical protein
VRQSEEQQYQELMQQHHYLGALPKISETLWYVALWCGQWVALLSFSASALKCAARDAWIGWNFRHQYDRLKLIVNNSRFLILPDWHMPNVGSRILSLCQRRLDADWHVAFGHPAVLLETFVDPQRFRGTVYKAAKSLLHKYLSSRLWSPIRVGADQFYYTGEANSMRSLLCSSFIPPSEPQSPSRFATASIDCASHR